jgi:hypothetical protein
MLIEEHTEEVSSSEISWLSMRMNLSYVSVSKSWLNGDIVAAILILGIFTGNTAHIDSTTEGTRQYLTPGSVPDEMRRPMNALSVAASVGIPRETARTKIRMLEQNGLLTVSSEGVVLSPDALLFGSLSRVVPGYLAALEEFLTGLRTLGAYGLSRGRNFSHPFWDIGGAVMRLGTAHVLRTTNAVQALWPDLPFNTKYTFSSISHLVGFDLRIEDRMSPDGGALAPLRPGLSPVSGCDVARFTGLPEETARRHIRALVDMGAVVRNKQGYDVNLDNHYLLSRWEVLQDRSNTSTRQFVSKLRSAGLLT